jgi:hypothetical protein
MRLAIAALAGLLAACGEGGGRKPTGAAVTPDPDPGPDAITARAAQWAATSPPPARACQADGDCGVFAVAPGDDPCCDVSVTAAPMNVHYMKANADWRVANCAAVSCPANELPGARPASCAFVARCAEGTCGNTCDQVPDPSPRSAMPSGSPDRLACKVDDDCAVVGWAPHIKNPCCDGSPIPTAVSRSYLEAVHMWRPLGCKDVECPPRDTSTFSLDECATTPRCLKKKCADACGR